MDSFLRPKPQSLGARERSQGHAHWLNRCRTSYLQHLRPGTGRRTLPRLPGAQRRRHCSRSSRRRQPERQDDIGHALPERRLALRIFWAREPGKNRQAGRRAQKGSTRRNVAARDVAALDSLSSRRKHDYRGHAQARPCKRKHRRKRCRPARQESSRRIEETSLGPNTAAVVGLGSRAETSIRSRWVYSCSLFPCRALPSSRLRPLVVVLLERYSALLQRLPRRIVCSQLIWTQGELLAKEGHSCADGGSRCGRSVVFPKSQRFVAGCCTGPHGRPHCFR